MSGPRYHGTTHSVFGTDPIPGSMVWARRRAWSASDQSITSGSESNVALNGFVTDNASYFSAYDVGSVDGINILQNGFYSILARLFWVAWPGDHELVVNGVDPDAYAGYSFSAAGASNTLVSAGGMDARVQAGQVLYLTVFHSFGSSKSLVGAGGCFLEVRRLDDITVTDTDGGP